MKKNDYSDVEKVLSEKAGRLVNNTTYSGAVRSADISNKKKEEKRAVFAKPALQIAGAFLAAAIVGGGTFGALKYLEYKGQQTPPAATDTTEQTYPPDDTGKSEQTPDAPGEATLISDKNGVKVYDYTELLKKYEKASYGGETDNFVLLLSGGQAYSVNTFKYQKKTKVTGDYYTTEDYRPDVYSQPAVKFGGDLKLYSNVEGREMKVVRVRMKMPEANTSNHIFASVEEAYKTMFTKKAGTYELTVDVTWDESDDGKLEKGDSYTLYRIAFDIYKEESYGGKIMQWYEAGGTGKRFVAVTSGGERTGLKAARKSYTKIVSESVNVKKGFTDSIDPENVIYGDDFAIENNVYDREMTVITAYLRESAVDLSTEKEMTLDELYEYLRDAKPGKYYVTLELTWDKYPIAEIGDEGYVYKTVFTVTKGEEKSSFFVVYDLKLDNLVDADGVKLKTENPAGVIKQAVSDEINALKFRIYKYNAAKSGAGSDEYNNWEAGIFALNSVSKCILNFEPQYLIYSPTTLIYALDTPSEHPMFFFTALQTYSGIGYIDTMVYAYDTVTGELKQFTVPRTESDTRARYGGVLGYDAENHEIILKTYKADEKTQTEQLFTTGELTYDEDAYVGYSRLVWTGEDYTFKFQKAAENTPDTDTDAETQSEPPEDFNAEGRLIIYTGNKPNYPVVTAKTVYKNGAAEKTDYNVTPEVYLCGIDRYLDVEYNNRQRRVYGVTVNGERTFDNFSDAFEYIEANKTYYPEAVTVKAEITWDAEALTNPDADRTTYTFEFAVTFTDPGSETQTPESDPTFIQMKQQLIVQIEDEKYFPDIIRKTAYKNGAAKTTEYIRDDIKITWNGTDGISAVNNIYSQWHIYAVTVNGEETFDAPYKAFDYIKDKNGTYRMEIEVTWDSAAVSDPEADRTTYTYAFEVERIKN